MIRFVFKKSIEVSGKTKIFEQSEKKSETKKKWNFNKAKR